nr:MarR family transcriptional regulator [Desulfobacula sp.]
MEPYDNFLEGCLFFNTNALSRTLLKLAEKEFKPLKLSPAHASLMLLVYDTPGISPKHLSRLLNLTPSTITRFVDVLEKKKLLKREAHGKSTHISPSEKGLRIKAEVALAYKQFVLNYTRLLGAQATRQLSFSILTANKEISESSDQND